MSSARPGRRRPCWSCCMSCTTSWPSKQVILSVAIRRS
ncbi:rCG60791, isoform CRA_b [Rattus norvegicus]|uniref:RCG60791, isoform CRA_b n=1 Tax=Rattus norvegicus TaxID=10116 RepID=A6JJL6_RAT|nr:rCG60791, isoform CRA_b [Rattus norvegicus]